jgi:site-specific recombinase XerD
MIRTQKHILTNQLLKELCETIVTHKYVYYPQANDYFTILYQTGCRTQEPIQINRWQALEGGIRMQPQKANNTRDFKYDELPESYVKDIRTQNKPFNGLTERQLTSVLKKLSPYVRVTTEIKEVTAYIYRYNFVKQMSDSGFTKEEIMNIMGWKNIAMVNEYVQQQLWYETPV